MLLIRRLDVTRQHTSLLGHIPGTQPSASARTPPLQSGDLCRRQDVAAGYLVDAYPVGSDGARDAGERLLPLQDVRLKRAAHLQPPAVPVVSLYLPFESGHEL